MRSYDRAMSDEVTYEIISASHAVVERQRRRDALPRPRSVTVYALGLTHASVCTSQPDEQTLATVDELYPTGLNHGWKISDDPAFADGKPNPCPCDHHPRTHRHVLLVC